MHELREVDGRHYFIPFELADSFDYWAQNGWMFDSCFDSDFDEYLIEEPLAQRILEEEEMYA